MGRWIRGIGSKKTNRLPTSSERELRKDIDQLRKNIVKNFDNSYGPMGKIVEIWNNAVQETVNHVNWYILEKDQKRVSQVKQKLDKKEADLNRRKKELEKKEAERQETKAQLEKQRVELEEAIRAFEEEKRQYESREAYQESDQRFDAICQRLTEWWSLGYYDKDEKVEIEIFKEWWMDHIQIRKFDESTGWYSEYILSREDGKYNLITVDKDGTKDVLYDLLPEQLLDDDQWVIVRFEKRINKANTAITEVDEMDQIMEDL